MKKNFIKYFLTVILTVLILGNASAYALQCINTATGEVVTAPPNTSCGPGQSPVAELQDFEKVFSNVVGIAGALVGFGLFIMLILGGIRYMMSGGDPKALQAAKGTITWAIIGLALFAISFTILLIVQSITGVNVTIFRIIF